MEGVLLQTVEGLGNCPFVSSAGETWELLQAEKESVAREIMSPGPLPLATDGWHEIEPSEECARDIEWRHRGSLDDRLRAINDAQDRLIDGGYGICGACGERISDQRLLADAATSLCFDCQRIAEGELLCRTL